MANKLTLYKKTTLYLANLILCNLNSSNFRLPTETELSETQGISRITARKAYKEIEALGVITRVKGKGTFIAPGTTYVDLDPILKETTKHEFCRIGAILPLFDSQHIMEINAAMLEGSQNIKLLVSCSNMQPEREERLINEYIEMGVNGLIIYPADNEIYNSALINLAVSNFPVILLDRYLPGMSFPYVSSDHKSMVRLAVNHLTERGNTHILFFNCNFKTNSPLDERREEYIHTLCEMGNYNNYFFNFDGNSDSTSKSFAASFRAYLDNNPQITAIITSDYASGIHLLQLAEQLGINFPDDYEAVFLDFKMPNNKIYMKMPTFVEQNSFELGFEAIKLIEQRIANPSEKGEPKLIPVKLVQGYSTKKL